MSGDRSRPCQKDKRCYRWDGHPGPHAYPDTGWGPCTATEHAPGCSHVHITDRKASRMLDALATGGSSMTARLVVLTTPPEWDRCSALLPARHIKGSAIRCDVQRHRHERHRHPWPHPFTGPTEVTAEDVHRAFECIHDREGDECVAILTALTAPPEDAAMEGLA